MRKTARLLLKRRWLSASLTTFVALIAAAVLTLPYLFLSDKIALVCSIGVSLFLSRPLLMGHKRWCAKLTFDDKPRLSEVFYFFTTPKRYLKSFLTGVTVFLRTAFIAVLSMLPSAGCFFLADWLRTQPQNEINEIFINNCLMLGIVAAPLFFVVFILSAIRSVAAEYFVAVDERVTVVSALKQSSRLVKQRGGYLFRTLLILIPLCLLVVPLVIIIPYFVTLFAQCVKEFKKE